MAMPSASMAGSCDPCEHKMPTGCMLAALPVCCACADKRPMAAAYPIYIDGAGMRNEGRRWHKYCWKCREYHMQQELFDISPAIYSSQTMPADRSQRPARAMMMPALPRHTSARDANTVSSQMHYSLRERTRSAIPIVGHTHPQARHELDNPPFEDLHGASATSAQSSMAAEQPHAHASELPATSTTQQRQRLFPLGTREEAEQEDYQSPLTGMFMRAWDRYRTAEEVRRAEQALNPQASEFAPRSAPSSVHAGFVRPSGTVSHATNFHRRFYTDTVAQNLDGANSRGAPLRNTVGDMDSNITVETTSMSNSVLQGNLSDSRYANPFNWVNEPLSDQAAIGVDEQSFDGQGPNVIDLQDRPPALSSEDMFVDVSCRICKEQKIDTLTLPCGHFVMCHWCAAAWAEEARRARRENRQTTYQHRCPMCRQQIKETKRVHLC